MLLGVKELIYLYKQKEASGSETRTSIWRSPGGGKDGGEREGWELLHVFILSFNWIIHVSSPLYPQIQGFGHFTVPYGRLTISMQLVSKRKSVKRRRYLCAKFSLSLGEITHLCLPGFDLK